MLLSGCNSMENDQPADRMPIRLTTGIQPTRTATTQDEQIVSGQDVYCWAKLGDDAYFDAWRLTANGSGSFGSQSSTRYYPEEALTMYLTHGNFQPAVVDEVTALPASLTHQVKPDQRQLADYAKSDLLYYYESGVTASASKQITFTHKLSKIVVLLEDGNSGSDYSAAELAKAEVRLTDINPQITMDLDDSGTLPTTVSAGTTTIVPYQESASTPSFEAIIPCNQVKPTTLISVTLNGQTATLNPTAPADAAQFEGGKKYTYTVTVSKTAMTVAVTSITNWTNYSGSDITNLPAQTPVDVRKNPLWYVAKSNLNAGGTAISTIGSTSQGGLWQWANAMTLGFTASTSSYDGYAVSATPKPVINGEPGSTWHIPTHMELISIMPGTQGFDIFKPENYSGETIVIEPACTFGYDNDTKYGKGNTSNPTTPTGTRFKSVWSTYNNDSVRYAIRFLGTEFCSVWRYTWVDQGTTLARFIINSKLIDQINPDETDKLAAMLTTIQSADYEWSENENLGAVERIFYATGYSGTTAPGTSNPNCYVGFWGTTEADGDNTRAWRIDVNAVGIVPENKVDVNPGISLKENARTIRLFRDNNDIMRNPLYYVSEYNLKSDCTFDTQLNSSQGNRTTWNVGATSVMRLGYTYTTDGTSYNGYALPVTRKTVSNGTTGLTWHAPTLMEMRSIFPSNSTSNTGTNIMNQTYWASSTVLTEPACTFGYNCSTKYSNGVSNTDNVGIQYKSYWSSYNSTENARYAIRFLGTPYCSVWKYQFLDLNTTSGRLVVSARLIDPIADTDLTALAAKMTEITSNSYNWNAGYDKGCVVRSFYACGYGSEEPATFVNTHGLYWTTTECNETQAFYMCYLIANLDTHALAKSEYRGLRLFLDN